MTVEKMTVGLGLYSYEQCTNGPNVPTPSSSPMKTPIRCTRNRTYKTSVSPSVSKLPPASTAPSPFRRSLLPAPFGHPSIVVSPSTSAKAFKQQSLAREGNGTFSVFWNDLLPPQAWDILIRFGVTDFPKTDSVNKLASLLVKTSSFGSTDELSDLTLLALKKSVRFVFDIGCPFTYIGYQRVTSDQPPCISSPKSSRPTPAYGANDSINQTLCGIGNQMVLNPVGVNLCAPSTPPPPLPPPPLSPPPLPSSKPAKKRQSKKTKSKSKISRSLPSQTKIKSDNSISDGNNSNNISVNEIDYHSCPLCEETIYSDGGAAVGCDVCGLWLHQTCLRLSDYQFQLLTMSDYVCNICCSKQCGVPDLPEPTIIPQILTTVSGKSKWGSVSYEKFSQSINSAYDTIVHFRSNLCNVPSGKAGKLFINELTYWLKQINAGQSKLNSIALRAFMVLPALILQKPSKSSKASEHTTAVERRMDEWKNGDIPKLLKDAKLIQSKLKTGGGRAKTSSEVAKLFARMIMHGKIGAAMKLLDKEGCTGVLPLSDETIKGLKSKHPEPGRVADGSLLRGPIDDLPASFVEGINEQLIMKAALRTKGSAGPSGLDADVFRRILCSKNFATAGKAMREEIATFTRKLLTEDYDPSLIQPLTSCRLIPLNKNPGIRPIGVGEVLRRIMGKAVSWSFKSEIREAAGPLQTCASHGAGAEAAIHGMRELFEEEEAEAVLLIDASNAFNSMNRMVGLHNIRIQCPYLSKYLINTYRQQSRLFITGGGEIASMEGTTQGDPLAMPWYSINTELMIFTLRRFIERVKQVWFADDASAVGLLQDLLEWYKRLCVEGQLYGYIVNGSKSWLIVKSEKDATRAKEIFGDLVNITTEGQRHLGAALGSKGFKDTYCSKKVENWTNQMKVLTEIAKTQPQSAYVGFTKGFVSKFTYFLRTIEGFEEYTDMLQEVINDAFVPSLAGEDTLHTYTKQAIQSTSKSRWSRHPPAQGASQHSVFGFPESHQRSQGKYQRSGYLRKRKKQRRAHPVNSKVPLSDPQVGKTERQDSCYTSSLAPAPKALYETEPQQRLLYCPA